MSFEYILLLAIIQGITEFLPVSSSAHLILLPHIFGMPDQGYEIDVAVHFGSLFAVMIYFRKEVIALFRGGVSVLLGRFRTEEAGLFLKLVLASIPVIALGGALSAFDVIDALRNPTIIGITMIGFGVLLYAADQSRASHREFSSWGWRDAIIMGLWQALALIPGVSRSGACVTASRFLDFERSDGAKIAMLMSIPTILAGAALLTLKIMSAPEGAELGRDALLAALASFVAAYLALGLMMRFLKTVSYTPYVIYRVLLGAVLLLMAL